MSAKGKKEGVIEEERGEKRVKSVPAVRREGEGAHAYWRQHGDGFCGREGEARMRISDGTTGSRRRRAAHA